MDLLTLELLVAPLALAALVVACALGRALASRRLGRLSRRDPGSLYQI